MRDLDDTDREILRLLVEDGRRPYSEIADRVGVSPPTVSDRVERLRELGVIDRFTLELDRSKLDGGIEVLVQLDLYPGGDGLTGRLLEIDEVENVFETADGQYFVTAIVPGGNVNEILADVLDVDVVRDYDIHLLDDTHRDQFVTDSGLALNCSHCGDAVDDDGESSRIDGALYHFCSETCRTEFESARPTLTESA